MITETDQVLCECEIEKLINFVSSFESSLNIDILLNPKLGMTMIQAEDSIDLQPFYLGEVLITECELNVNGTLGYGYCMGDNSQRAYCIALIDAILHISDHPLIKEISLFIDNEKAILENKKLEEYNQILKTKVDFKIMEQN
jgi:alpha-D-ribose 1-methylphosphonate 5-triphosphate synthase subunit PhnG